VEAIIGLIGVIVGGLLSAVASYLSARSLEGTKIAAYRRAAARLVNQELKRASHTLALGAGRRPLRESGRAPSAQPGVALNRADWRTLKWDLDERLPQVSSEVWEAHPPALAEALHDSEWQAVEKAYDELSLVQPIDADLRKRSGEPELASWEHRVEAAIDAIAEARAALEKAASHQSA
jgi:hypothetical protein